MKKELKLKIEKAAKNHKKEVIESSILYDNEDSFIIGAEWAFYNLINH